MEIQLKDTQGNYLYPILSEDDAANTIRLKKSIGGAALYPSVDGIEGNCNLKTKDGIAYPVVLDTPIEPAWTPTSVAVELVASGTTYYQGLAVYNGYGIYFNDSSSTFTVKRMADGTTAQVATSFQDADTNRHSNTLNFGTLKYDDADDFPLLYGSGNLNALAQTIDVYRVTLTGSVWSVVKVQTIDFSAIDTYTDAAFYSDYIVLKRGANVMLCNMPPIKDSNDNILSTYTMSASDVVTTYTFDDYYQYAQGYTVIGRYMLNLTMSSTVYNYITVMDMVTGRQRANFPLNALGITFECEQIAFDESTSAVYLTTRNNGYYTVTFTPELPVESNSEE